MENQNDDKKYFYKILMILCVLVGDREVRRYCWVDRALSIKK